MSENFDLIIEGNLLTMTDDQPVVEAVGIKNGMISAIGNTDEIAKGAGEKTRYLRLKDKTILPGLIDAHMHPSHVGSLLLNIDLTEATSVGKILQKIKEKASKTPAGELVLAQNFNYQVVAEKRLPSLEELNSISREHPIVVVVYDVHSAMLNSRALEMLDISKDEKGYIKYADGKPTGLLEDPVITKVLKQIQPKSEADVMPTIQAAAQEALKAGITTLHMKDSLPIINIVLKNEADIPVRVKPVIMFNPEDLDILPEILNGEQLQSRAVIAFFADGAPDSKTAAFFEPYPDDPSNFGMLYYTSEGLEKCVAMAHNAGFQVSVHACGSRANEQVIKTYEKVLKQYPRDDHRHRIEHLERPYRDQTRRIVLAGITLCMQPMFLFFSGEETFQNETNYWGSEATSRWKPFRSIIDAGGLIAGGSDAPVTRMSPLKGISACVNHPNAAERITIFEALKMFTVNAAKIGFEENIKGSIEPEKLADFVVLSENPFGIEQDKIGDIKVEMTIVGGEIKFKAD
ncbi:MAG: amidohydrolase [Desulfobacterales bacterium]|nr:amidohydrolase [Desulfobacterales bacterium]